MGVNMRPSPTPSTRGDKTSSTPSREAMARQQRPIGAVGRRHRLETQARLMEAVHPVIRGWRHAVSTVCRHETCEPMDAQRRPQRRSWIRLRHPHKTRPGGDPHYWRCEEGPRHVTPRARGKR